MRSRLENLRLTTKMVFPIAVMVLVALGIVVFAERSLHTLTAQTHEIIRVTAARQALALGAVASVNGAAANEKNAMLMTDKTGLDAFASGYVTDIDHLKESIAHLKELSTGPAETELLEQMAGAIDAYFATGEQLYQFMVDKEFDRAHGLSTGAAQIARERLIELIRREVDQTTKKMQGAEGLADALYRRTVGLLIAWSVGGLFCAMLMVIWITRRLILRPLTTITDAMGRLSRGDLEIEIDEVERRDEIGILARALKVFREHSLALRQREIELRTARDAAINADRSKSEFLANMSHELRTPLNAVIGFAEMMRDEVFGELGNDRYRSYAADIHGSGSHLLAIINDILDLAKIDAGSMQLREQEIDLVSLCKAALTIVWPRALQAGITIDMSGVPEDCALWADERLLKQALLNLLANAVKFSHPNGKVRITATLAREGSIEIRVVDTGIGMRAEDIPLVLKPFVQIDGSLQRRYEGTGLGLPLTKSIVGIHGGELAIESAPGVGTTVTVRLPADRRRMPPQVSRQSADHVVPALTAS
jgi:signal transduction histidine kinase